MDDNEFVKIIEQAMKVSAFMNQGRKGFNLKSHFLLESDGSFKSDICRTVALYLHGGYCFDVDMEVVEPIVGIKWATGFDEHSNLKLNVKLEDEESNILSLVSAGVKNDFGQPGFVKWNRNFPVIETSPFDVIPGNVLD